MAEDDSNFNVNNVKRDGRGYGKDGNYKGNEKKNKNIKATMR